MRLRPRGQIDVDAVGRIDSVNGPAPRTFEALPDVPVSRIDVDLAGGRKGLVDNSESLCGRPKRATVADDRPERGHLGGEAQAADRLWLQAGQRATTGAMRGGKVRRAMMTTRREAGMSRAVDGECG